MNVIESNIGRGRGLAKIVVGVVAVALALVFTSCSMKTVGTGHRGVKVRFGQVIGDGLPEGLYFVNPLTTHIQEIDTRVLKWEAETQAYTRDVQQAKLQFVLNYRLDPTKAHVVYQQVGADWGAKLVGQVIFEEMKREVGQHEAVDLIAQRDSAARKIEANVSSLLAKRNVIVTGFQLTNIDYTPEFEHAVEAKVIAQQKAIEEQNRTVQVREQANQKVETAKGNAESTILNAKAEAESISIRARALEQNAKLVQWEAVQKWNGTLPTYMLGNAVPFIQIPSGQGQ
jgi:regulator of protease activity HflC (stomatin/prohibitin superfamily)